MVGSFLNIYCDECGVEITWTPVVIDGRPYCCHDCAIGIECDCASGEPPREDESWTFWMGGFDGSIESTYSIDYGFE